MTRGRASLTASLRALEVVRDGAATLLVNAGRPVSALAHVDLTDNVIQIALEMAVALKSAAAGDTGAAARVVEALGLDQIIVTVDGVADEVWRRPLAGDPVDTAPAAGVDSRSDAAPAEPIEQRS